MNCEAHVAFRSHSAKTALSRGGSQMAVLTPTRSFVMCLLVARSHPQSRTYCSLRAIARPAQPLWTCARESRNLDQAGTYLACLTHHSSVSKASDEVVTYFGTCLGQPATAGQWCIVDLLKRIDRPRLVHRPRRKARTEPASSNLSSAASRAIQEHYTQECTGADD